MATNGADVCPPPMKATSNGSWQGDNPLDYALPLAILQICLVVVFTRALAFLLQPLRQPRVIAEVIGGILLGPSAIGRNERFLQLVFPKRSLPVLETLANIGLLFFLFLVGLELDIRAIRRTGTKALAIAVVGISLPFVMGIGTSAVLRRTVSQGASSGPFLVFMGVALSVTAFPVLARILGELKLLTTDVGRMAMSAAAVNDVAAWILLALAIALSGSDSSPLVSIWVLLTGIAFVGFAVLVIRPLLSLMARRSPEGEPVKEVHICVTLSVVLAAGFVTDTIGIHSLFGAFIVGVVVPKEGGLSGVLIEKVEDLVSGLFLPLYFVSSGLKTDVATIRGAESWALLLLVIATACLGKIGGTVLVSLAFRVPRREALALGLLMNTKGLVELIVLNIGKDRKVLNDQTFAILVLMALFTTFITTPLVTAAYKPARRAAPYKHRTVQRNNPQSELRIMACFHSSRNIPTIINLIESSRGTRRRGITVYTMHLMELSERSSSIFMVHKARRNGLPFWNRIHDPSNSNDHIVIAFQAYHQLSRVAIRPMTAISHLNSLHEDITASAQQKRVALIVLPFHKHQCLDGTMVSLGNSFRHVNLRVLRNPPCSVGILVDRGLGGTTQVSASDVSLTVIVLFFGGRDDREALAYGCRMAEHPGIHVSVFRFVAEAGKSLVDSSGESVGVAMEADEHPADEACIAEVRSKIHGTTANSRSPTLSTSSISLEEVVVGSKEEVAVAVKGTSRCNLFLVGRTPPVASLVETDCPEMGPVGCFLVSQEMPTTASVLVLQQYDPSADLWTLSEEVDGDVQEEVTDTPAGARAAGE